MIIDTHIHLYDERYQENLEEIIQDALDNDVGKMIIVGFDYESSKQAIALADKYPFMYASVGLHPSEVHKEKDIELNWLLELARNPKVVAIGEIGLDYYWDKTYLETQKEMFIKQIHLAKKLDLPIIVHSRDASLDTYNILKEYQTKGVLHCYSQSVEMAREYVKLGYYLGIGGVVTFKNSKEIKEVVRAIDLEYLLSETDGPYLAPTPFRGKLNKPSYLRYIIEEISVLKKLDVEKTKKELEQNANKLFNLRG